MIFRTRGILLAIVLVTVALVYFWPSPAARTYSHSATRPAADTSWQTPDYFWAQVEHHYPVAAPQPLPQARPRNFPRVQAASPRLSDGQRALQTQRQQAVKAVFARCWSSYRKHAWASDELQPVSGGRKDPFGGWAATLVDSLDTLWIMDMKDEFDEAVTAAEAIDFTKSTLNEVNIFETTIRYLGGFLSAFDLSGDMRLLRKAAQVGEMIYKAFDTPNHMPLTRWDFHAAAKGESQTPASSVLVAEIGSLCIELTRLSQLTGDPKWFDASQRIMDLLAAQQDSTSLPGQWPLVVDAKSQIFNVGETFTLGAMADSVYEYLPKMAALLGGQLPVYQVMYEKAIDTALKHNIFRPMTPDKADILLSGEIHARRKDGSVRYELEPQGQHLVCFLGGVMALGGRLFDRQQDVVAAEKLTNGCIFTYSAFPHGIMPEVFYMVPCESKDVCEWDENRWKQEVLSQAEQSDTSNADPLITNERLPKGFSRIPDRRYILRPEAIESVFVMYRVTAREEFAEHAWTMFNAIENVTRTELANTAVADVTVADEKPLAMDSMESFWMGETLKYLYLTFSDPSLISLDEFVFNTEAHPVRRLVV